MGVGSWLTADTKRSIPVSYSGDRGFPFTLICPDGRKIHATHTDGYGNIGGEDMYQLLAEWHGFTDRDDGIRLEETSVQKFFLKFVEDPELGYAEVPHSRRWVSLQCMQRTPTWCRD